MKQIVAFPRRRPLPRVVGRGPDEQIDKMLPPLIHKRRHGSIFQIIQAPAYQRESVPGQILDGRREIELAVEPRLDRVLVG